MNHRTIATTWQQDWRRVSKEKPCPVCGKPDWCLDAHDGSATLCKRTPEGAIKLCDAGWLHRHRDRAGWQRPRARRLTTRLHIPSTPQPEMTRQATQFSAAVDPNRLDRLARDLGVTAPSLRRLGIGWCAGSNAWSFPMTDAAGRVLGIRLRTGRKFAVEGGHEGLLVPEGLDGSGLLLVAEGPTDTAALLDLGFEAVGRPSCRGATALLIDLVEQRHPTEAVIVADRDEAGQEGALGLVKRLVIRVPRLRILTPPPGIKDARDWRRAGATRESIMDAIRTAEIHCTSVPAEEVGHDS